MKRLRLPVLTALWAFLLSIPASALMSHLEAARFSRPADGTGSFHFCGNSIAEPLGLALNCAFPGMVCTGAAVLWLAARHVI